MIYGDLEEADAENGNGREDYVAQSAMAVSVQGLGPGPCDGWSSTQR